MNLKKTVVFCLLFVSFAAGFGLAFLEARHSTGVLNNNTTKSDVGQYDDPLSLGSGTVQKTSVKSDPNCLIKGKSTKAGKKIYYYPGSLFYSKLKNFQCFGSEQQARASGFQRSAH